MILAVGIPTNNLYSLFPGTFNPDKSTSTIYPFSILSCTKNIDIYHGKYSTSCVSSILCFLFYITSIFCDVFFFSVFYIAKRETSFASLSSFTLFFEIHFFTTHSSRLPQSALSSDDSLSELLLHHNDPGILSSVRSSEPSYQNLHRILQSSHQIRRPEYHLPE